MNAALKEQLDKLWHTTSIYLTDPVEKYTEQLLSKFPDNIQVKHCKNESNLLLKLMFTLQTCFFVNSGTEAVDLAVLAARLHSGNLDIITLRNSYHGLGQGIQGATNHSQFKQPIIPTAGFVRVSCLTVHVH